MAETLAIYARLARSRIRGEAQYRLSFVLQVVGAFLLGFLDFIAIVVMFRHIEMLDGWTLGEVSFLYGSSYIVFKFADMVMSNMDRLRIYIRLGTFDQVLTRPMGTLGQVLTWDVDLRHIGGMSQGALVLFFAVSRVDIDWNPLRVVLLLLMLVSGFLIYCGVWVATNSIAFWTTDAREVANAFTYGGNFLTQAPLSVYGTWMRRILGYGFALGFVSYFPALYILGRSDGTPAFVSFLSPVVAIGVLVVSGLVWRIAVRHYRSTGS